MIRRSEVEHEPRRVPAFLPESPSEVPREAPGCFDATLMRCPRKDNASARLDSLVVTSSNHEAEPLLLNPRLERGEVRSALREQAQIKQELDTEVKLFRLSPHFQKPVASVSAHDGCHAQIQKPFQCCEKEGLFFEDAERKT